MPDYLMQLPGRLSQHALRQAPANNGLELEMGRRRQVLTETLIRTAWHETADLDIVSAKYSYDPKNQEPFGHSPA
jgi:hypothetical protein